MIRSLLAKFVVMSVVSVVLMVSGASAQQGHDACARDVSRFCRAQMNDGDQVVLGCLKQNRAKLSKACEKVLTEHGQ
jgi:Cysteine rich repeat